MIKRFLSIFLFCLGCNASDGDIKAILVEKKEPANAVCYVSMSPFTIGTVVEVPYSEVMFLFADTNIDQKMPNIWIQFEDKKVKHLLFGDKRVKGEILKKEFIDKILKLRDSLEAKLA